MQSLFGLFVLVFLAWLLSAERRLPDWRLPVSGLALQFGLALLLLKVPLFKAVFSRLNDLILALDEATRAGPPLSSAIWAVRLRPLRLAPPAPILFWRFAPCR